MRGVDAAGPRAAPERDQRLFEARVGGCEFSGAAHEVQGAAAQALDGN
ncbi:MAG: hypothetical protein V9G24_21320 [Rhodoblastus sp.]